MEVGHVASTPKQADCLSCWCCPDSPCCLFEQHDAGHASGTHPNPEAISISNLTRTPSDEASLGYERHKYNTKHHKASLTMSCGSARTPTILMRTSVPSLICVVASVDTNASPLTELYSKSSGINCRQGQQRGQSVPTQTVSQTVLTPPVTAHQHQGLGSSSTLRATELHGLDPEPSTLTHGARQPPGHGRSKCSERCRLAQLKTVAA